MNINGMTVCVDYAEYLAHTVERWKRTLRTLIVVTSPVDSATKQVCDDHGISYVETDAFYRNGAHFNKGLAMEEALQYMNWQDWILFFDADILPDPNWKQHIGQADPSRLNGARRLQYNPGKDDTPINDGGRVGWGYFQLFHSTDPHVQRTPLMDCTWKHAGGYDNSFRGLWPNEAKELPVHLLHLGENGNWFGVGQKDRYHEMQHKRSQQGGRVLPEERFI